MDEIISDFISVAGIEPGSSPEDEWKFGSSSVESTIDDFTSVNDL